MESCLNCGQSLTGAYCPDCGQRRLHGRLDLHELLHEFFHALTHADQGLLRLLKDLALRPRRVYLDYFAGRRKTYFNPVLFLLLVLGLTIAAQTLVLDHERAVFGRNNLFERSVAQLDKLRYFLATPAISLLAWLFFPRRFHFAEAVTFWLFCLGWANTVALPFLGFTYVLPAQRGLLMELAGWLGALLMFLHIWLVFFERTFSSATRSILLMLTSYIALDYSYKLLWVAKGEPVSLDLFELIADWFKILR